MSTHNYIILVNITYITETHRRNRFLHNRWKTEPFLNIHIYIYTYIIIYIYICRLSALYKRTEPNRAHPDIYISTVLFKIRSGTLEDWPTFFFDCFALRSSRFFCIFLRSSSFFFASWAVTLCICNLPHCLRKLRRLAGSIWWTSFSFCSLRSLATCSIVQEDKLLFTSGVYSNTAHIVIGWNIKVRHNNTTCWWFKWHNRQGLFINSFKVKKTFILPAQSSTIQHK